MVFFEKNKQDKSSLIFSSKTACGQKGTAVITFFIFDIHAVTILTPPQTYVK